MNLHRKILAPLAVLFMALLMQACTDNNPSEPSSQSVVGSWKLMTREDRMRAPSASGGPSPRRSPP